MDYSQFLLMHHEIGLLIVFILVFLFDTFGCKKVQGSLSVTALVLFRRLHSLWLLRPAADRRGIRRDVCNVAYCSVD